MKYTWTTNIYYDVWNNGLFDSVEEAIADAKYKLGNAHDQWMVFIAEADEYDFENLDLDLFGTVLCQVKKNIVNELGETPFSNLGLAVTYNSDAYSKANKKLNELVTDYFRDYNKKSPCFKIRQIIKQMIINES